MSTHPHSFGKIVWRFMSGNHLDGIARTDAGWLAAGHTDWTKRRAAGRWSYRPRLYRSAVRLASVLVLVTVAAGLRTHRTLTLSGLAVAGLAGTGLLIWLGVRSVRTHRHRARYVRPLHAVLAGPLGIPKTTRPDGWLSVPRDYATSDDAVIRVDLPPEINYTADLRTLVSNVIRDKLGIGEVSATWHTVGRAPYAVFKPAAHPPARVTYADVRQAIADAPETAPVIGLSAGGGIVAVDLEAEAPHSLLSMASGAGKSVLVRTISAQLLANGAQIIVLDAKRVSQSWLRSLPNVTYCRTPETAHQALLDLASEVDRRYDLIDQAPDDGIDSVDVGPRIVLVFEELVAMMGKLTRWWQTNREKSDPRTSPAISAFLEIVSMGRQGRVNVVAVAQMGTARVMGGSEVRESFSNRVLGRYSTQAWRMLCGDIWPMPRSSSHAGRVQVVNGGVAVETQVAYLTTDEARALAAKGAVTVPAGWSTSADTPVTVTPQTTSEPLYTLAEAARAGFLGLSYGALRQAASRARKVGEWPAGRVVAGTQKWTRRDLESALANRPRGVDATP